MGGISIVNGLVCSSKTTDQGLQTLEDLNVDHQPEHDYLKTRSRFHIPANSLISVWEAIQEVVANWTKRVVIHLTYSVSLAV